ncbi:MAG: hypothetical protein ACJA1Z_000136 [Patiriisocius sp.]|jgi:hypothetical protein
MQKDAFRALGENKIRFDLTMVVQNPPSNKCWAGSSHKKREGAYLTCLIIILVFYSELYFLL